MKTFKQFSEMARDPKKIVKKLLTPVKNIKDFDPGGTINLSGSGSGIDKKIPPKGGV